MIKLILALFIVFSAHSAELYLKTKKYKNLSTGDSFKAEISASEDIKFIEKEYNENVSPNLYLVSIIKKRKKYFGRFIISPINRNLEKDYFKINNTKYSYILTNISITDNSLRSKDIFVFDQAYKWKDNKNLIAIFIILLVLLLILGLFFIKKVLIKNKEKRIFIKEKNNWISFVSNIKSRNEHELFYKNKEKIKQYIKFPNDHEYFRTLSEIQYQEDWSDEDWDRLNSSYEKIIKVANSNGI